MAAWDKDTVFIQLVTPGTGEDDTTGHTVEVCPIENSYPSGAVTCTQCSTQLSRYYPSADLDDETHYGIFVDGTRIGTLFAKKSAPAIGV
jgi:hypothetical protein